MNKFISLLLLFCYLISKSTSAQYAIIQENDTYKNNSQKLITEKYKYIDSTKRNISNSFRYGSRSDEISGIKSLGTVTTENGIWTELNPKVPRVDYWGIYFLDNDTGLATGLHGSIIKTTNAGVSWYTIETLYTPTIRTIGSYSGDKIIAAGDGGLLIASTDYGETWQELQSGTTKNLWSVQFVTELIGWIVGEGSIALKTIDGGNTWVNQPTPLSGFPYWDVAFYDTLFGYICTNGGNILRTKDGGINWDITQIYDDYGLYTICTITKLKAVALGFAGKHVYTSDGGENWEFIGYTGIFEPNNIVFLDTLHGFAPSFGVTLETGNGGLSWAQRTNMCEDATNIVFPDGETGFIIGKEVTIEKTTNSGQSWFKSVINGEFSDVFFTDENNGWFIGSGRFDETILYQTTDGGESLIKRNDFPGGRPSSVYFFDNLNGIIGANNGMYKSYDGGVSWEAKNVLGIDSLSYSGEFNRIFFINSDIGWAINSIYILKTTDGGDNWQLQKIIGGLTGINFIDSLKGWVTPDARPYKTTDGGETWIEQSNFPVNNCNDVFFIDSLNGFITKLNYFYRTTNGGTDWSLVPEITDFIRGRFGNFSNDLFLAGGPRTYHSTDRGNTWNEVLELRDELVRFIRLSDINKGFAIGSNGLILKLTDSTTNLSNKYIQNPSEYHLSQNYPNPFNPSTTIRYEIPERSFVTIKVYDVLGNEIATLVNEENPTGSFEVEFDAKSLPSSIYFYRLQAGKYFQTKKMLLLK